MSQLKRQAFPLEPASLRWLQWIFYGSVLLYFGRDILVPLSFAVLISCMLYPVCVWLERKGLGKLTAIISAVTVLVILGLLLVALLISQLVAFIEEWPALHVKINRALEDLSSFLVSAFGMSRADQMNFLTRLSDQSGGNLLMVIRKMISASAGSAVVLFLIPVYSILILYYRRYWVRVLYRLFPAGRPEEIHEILSMTIGTYYNFIKGMALVYLVVGVLNSLGLLILGIPHPFLFGLIASILTFVPYVGIIAGSLLPITMAWITYDSLWYPVGIIAVFTFVQYLEANVIFPLAVSHRLNVNTLVMLVAIFVGGVLWGLAGMILFVPFVGILKLIADHNPAWRTVSLVLGTEEKVKRLRKSRRELV